MALDGHDLMDKWSVQTSEDGQTKGAVGAKALGQRRAWGKAGNEAGERWEWNEPGDDGREKGRGGQGLGMQGLMGHGGVSCN